MLLTAIVISLWCSTMHQVHDLLSIDTCQTSSKLLIFKLALLLACYLQGQTLMLWTGIESSFWRCSVPFGPLIYLPINVIYTYLMREQFGILLAIMHTVRWCQMIVKSHQYLNQDEWCKGLNPERAHPQLMQGTQSSKDSFTACSSFYLSC